MGNPDTAHEPSMEEILASIRQIISDDTDEDATQDAATDTEGDAAETATDDGEAESTSDSDDASADDTDNSDAASASDEGDETDDPDLAQDGEDSQAEDTELATDSDDDEETAGAWETDEESDEESDDETGEESDDFTSQDDDLTAFGDTSDDDASDNDTSAADDDSDRETDFDTNTDTGVADTIELSDESGGDDEPELPAAAQLAASLNEMSSPAPDSPTSEIEDTFASAIAHELSAAGLPGADSLSATASPAGLHGDDKTIPPIVEFSNSEQDTQAVPNTAKIETSDTSPRNTGPRNSGQGAQDDNLLSQDTGEAVSGAFNALTHTILAQNARTLDDLVREMLEPMLKEWLDDNLPSLVERMVRQEIDRVSRGRK